MKIAVVCALLVSAGATAGLLPEEETHYHAREIRGGFLVRGAGARAAAMGDAYAAVADDPSTVGINPGGLGQIRAFGASAAYGLIGNGMAFSHAAAAIPVDFEWLQKAVIGVGVATFSYGSYDVRDASGALTRTDSPTDAAVTVSVCLDNPAWSIIPGYTALGVEGVSEAAGGGVLGMTAGGVYPVSRSFRAGWAVQHLGPHIDGFTMPAVARVGVAYAPHPSLLGSVDLGYPIVDRQKWAGIGAEFSPVPQTSIRAGYRWRSETGGVEGAKGLTAGAGLLLGAFAVDYAYQPFGDIATAHRFSVTFRGRPPGSGAGRQEAEDFAWKDGQTGRIESRTVAVAEFGAVGSATGEAAMAARTIEKHLERKKGLTLVERARVREAAAELGDSAAGCAAPECAAALGRATAAKYVVTGRFGMGGAMEVRVFETQSGREVFRRSARIATDYRMKAQLRTLAGEIAESLR